MYTSLSPCDMCTGACVMYKVARVVIAENKTFVGGEEYLKKRGIEVVVFDDEKCKGLMKAFIEREPSLWYVWPYCGDIADWWPGMRISVRIDLAQGQ